MINATVGAAYAHRFHALVADGGRTVRVTTMSGALSTILDIPDAVARNTRRRPSVLEFSHVGREYGIGVAGAQH